MQYLFFWSDLYIRCEYYVTRIQGAFSNNMELYIYTHHNLEIAWNLA